MSVERLLDVAHVLHLCYAANTDLLAAIIIGHHHGPRVAIHLSIYGRIKITYKYFDTTSYTSQEEH